MNALSEQMVTIILSGMILIINGFLFFWLNSIRIDVRDLRAEYLKVVTEALAGNAVLKVEIEKLNGTINVLKTEIIHLREIIASPKEKG